MDKSRVQRFFAPDPPIAGGGLANPAPGAPPTPPSNPPADPAQQAAAKVADEAFFGTAPEAAPTPPKPAPGADPGAANPKPPETDPSKAPTAEPGSEGKSAQPKPFAGKYDSPEALEAGYNQLYGHTRAVERENAAHRERIAKLEAEIAVKGRTETRIPGESEGTTPAKTRELPPEMVKLRQRLAERYGDDDMKDFDAYFAGHMQQFESRFAETQGQVDAIHQAQLDAEFAAEYPEVKDPVIQKRMDELQEKVLKEKPDDPRNIRYLFLMASKGLAMPEIIDAAVAKAKLRWEKDERGKVLAGGAVVGGNLGASGQPDTRSEAQREAEEAFYGKPSS